MERMNAYALTGNLGCGKSEVAKIFEASSNVETFDADRVAKQLLASHKYREQLIEILGKSAFKAEGPDFKKIANVIFHDEDKLRELEKFLHPKVWRVIESEVAASPADIRIVQSALIYETKSDQRFRSVIVVTCGEQEQMRRLTKLRKMSVEDIDTRLARQMSSTIKWNRARFRIDTQCSREELERRAMKIMQRLQQEVG